MKPVRALLAALVLAFAAPVAAQPGLDDPELMAWMVSANAAQKARLEALAARGDVDALLMAMSLVHPMFPLREDPEAEIAAEQARAWALLGRAAQVDPGHPLVAWKLATCPADSGLAACGSPASRERLQAVAGSRAAVQLWLAHVAQAVGDEAALETHMQAAADATGYGAFEHEEAGQIWAAWDGVEFPPASPEVTRSYARHIEIDPEAFVEQMVAISVIARIAAQAMPGLSFSSEACDVAGGGEAIGASRRRQCLAIFTMMADAEGSLVQRLVGEQGVVRLIGQDDGADAWKARLRTTAWVHQTAAPLTSLLSSRHDPDYVDAWRQGGEYLALLYLLERRGLGRAPPAGWEPADERMRALLAAP